MGSGGLSKRRALSPNPLLSLGMGGEVLHLANDQPDDVAAVASARAESHQKAKDVLYIEDKKVCTYRTTNPKHLLLLFLQCIILSHSSSLFLFTRTQGYYWH